MAFAKKSVIKFGIPRCAIAHLRTRIFAWARNDKQLERAFALAQQV